MFRRSFLEGRRLRTAFLVSLALNFFFLAFGISVYLERPRSFPPSPERIVEILAGNLSGEGEAVLLETFEKHRPRIMAQHAAAIETKRKARALVGEQELNVEALRTARQDMRQAMATLMLELDGFLIEATSQLSPDDRRRLAEAVPK